MHLRRLRTVLLPYVFVICTRLCVKLKARLGCQSSFFVTFVN